MCSINGIEVRVAPNFGYWHNCSVGQWVASLHHPDGSFAGANRWAESIEKASVQGLRLACMGRVPECELATLAESDWPVIVQ